MFVPLSRCELSVGKTLFAGGLAGICNWVVAIPVDVVKSRLQAAPEGVYSGAMDVFLKLLRSEGVGALWKGAVPVLMRWEPNMWKIYELISLTFAIPELSLRTPPVFWAMKQRCWVSIKSPLIFDL